MSQPEFTPAEQERLDQFSRALASALSTIKNKEAQVEYILVARPSAQVENHTLYSGQSHIDHTRRQDGPTRQRQAFSAAGIPA